MDIKKAKRASELCDKIKDLEYTLHYLNGSTRTVLKGILDSGHDFLISEVNQEVQEALIESLNNRIAELEKELEEL